MFFFLHLLFFARQPVTVRARASVCARARNEIMLCTHLNTDMAAFQRNLPPSAMPLYGLLLFFMFPQTSRLECTFWAYLFTFRCHEKWLYTGLSWNWAWVQTVKRLKRHVFRDCMKITGKEVETTGGGSWFIYKLTNIHVEGWVAIPSL